MSSGKNTRLGEKPKFVLMAFQCIVISGSSTDLKIQRKMEASHHPTQFFVGSVTAINRFLT
jgi:hypothetical protein